MTNFEIKQRVREPAARAPQAFGYDARAAEHRYAKPGGGPATSAVASVLSSYAADDDETQAILAAVKPDDHGDVVLRMAEWLAEQEHRELHVVSVVDSTTLISAFAAGAPVIPPFHDEESRRAVKQELRAAYQRIGRAAPRVRIDVLEGTAAATIADIAREQEVRMVIVGKGTHGLVSQLVYGEQVMQIIRASRRPVLVVPSDAPVPIERAAVAFDFSRASIRAAVTAYGMLGAGGRLSLVHVAKSRRVAGRHADWFPRSTVDRTRATLDEFAHALRWRAGVTVVVETLHGDPVAVLSAYTQSRRVQLLGCGWHVPTLLERLFGGSHTTRLLHRVQCSVLVTPDARAGGARNDAA
jgi:nucleotide-binding universal stress UspA family protein